MMVNTSKHGIKSQPSTVEFWTTTVGDAGELFYGHARIGAHSFTTATYYSTRAGAEVAALGLVAGHVACVGVTYEGRELAEGRRTYRHARDCSCGVCCGEPTKKAKTRRSRAKGAAGPGWWPR
jgi:hypothetical protein